MSTLSVILYVSSRSCWKDAREQNLCNEKHVSSLGFITVYTVNNHIGILLEFQKSLPFIDLSCWLSYTRLNKQNISYTVSLHQLQCIHIFREFIASLQYKRNIAKLCTVGSFLLSLALVFCKLPRTFQLYCTLVPPALSTEHLCVHKPVASPMRDK